MKLRINRNIETKFFGKIWFLNLILFLITSLCQAYEIGFNCGSPTVYTARDGEHYEPDQEYSQITKAGYIGGYIGKSPGEVKSGGTRDYDLYLQDRRGLSEYRFDVSNGSYVVKLHFSETEHHWRTLRIFDVWIENQKVLKNFDIFEKVQRNYAIDYQFPTRVTDGQLNVEMSATKGETMLSAIYVFSRTPDSTSPRMPQGFSAMEGYKQVILDWADNPEDDIGGYHVYRSEGDKFSMLARTPSSRYIDNAVEVHQIYQYYVRAVDVYGNEGEKTLTLEATTCSKADAKLPVYELYLDESHLVYLSKHVWDDITVPVIFQHQGVEYNRARMRYRGGAARRDVLKPSIKLIFADDQLFQGRKKLNLQSDTWDSSLMRSKLAFDDYKRAGALAPAAEWVHLRLNGEFIGVYTAVEQIDERFLTINGRDPTGNIYKPFDFLVVLPNEEDYARFAEKETNKGGSYFDLQEFVELINLTPQHLIHEKLSEVLDVEEYLNWYCVNQLISNWDIAGHNFYLYHDLQRNKWEVIAWDPDVSYAKLEMPIDEGTRNHPMYGVADWWDRLIDKVFSVPQFRRMYCLRLLELMDTLFDDEARIARLEAGHQQIRFDAERDIRKPGWHENDVWFYPSLKSLRDFVYAKNAYLRAAVNDYMPPASVNLFINEISVVTEEQGWLELYNCSKETIELNALYLSDDVSQPMKWRLPDRTIAPGDYLILECGKMQSPFADRGQRRTGKFPPFLEGGLGGILTLNPRGGFIALSDNGQIVNQVDYPDFKFINGNGDSYGRVRDGSGRWDILKATPGSSNKFIAPVEFAKQSRESRIVSKPQPLSQHIVKGTHLKHSVSLRNQTNQTQIVSLWCDLFLPGGKPYQNNPIIGPQQIQLAPHEMFDRKLTIPFPESLPSGISYKYAIQIGNKEQVWDTLPIQLSVFSQYATQTLYINEFMAANQRTITDEYSEYDDWVELYNGGDKIVNLDGMYLSDDMREPNKWQIRGVEIPAGGYLLFWLDNDEPQGIQHTSFSLSASGEGIGIFDTDENDNAVIDWIPFGLQQADVSFGRYPDGDTHLECFVHSTPREINISHGRLNLFLNELMVNNHSTIADETGEYDAWIELHNAGCNFINLEGLYLSNDESKPTQWRFPAIGVPPGGFVLIWADGKEKQGMLHTNFRLNPDGGFIVLSDTDEHRYARIDAVIFDRQPADTSFGRYPNGLGAWVNLPNPTPGGKNALPKLYINEVMASNRSTIADEADEYDDWLELYNPANTSINLGGMFLSDNIDNPAKWRIPPIEVPARGFLLIWADGDENQGKLHASFNLNADAEVIALFDATEEGNILVDSIEFAEQQADISYGRYPDGSHSLETFDQPTPGAPNISNSETRAGPISLLQNYPNPFTLETAIPYKLSESAHIVLSIYNVRGQLVRQFDIGKREAGVYIGPERAVHWNRRNELGEMVASGIYFYTMRSGNYTVTRKLAIITK